MGMISSAMKHREKSTPRIALIFSQTVVSLLRCICTKAAAEVKQYPMAAPMEDISTIQLRTVRPNHGQNNEMIIMKMMAFIGVL